MIGDLAYVAQPDGKPLPGLAQVATQTGEYVAKTIMKRLKGAQNIKPFHYFNKGDLAVIGCRPKHGALLRARHTCVSLSRNR